MGRVGGSPGLLRPLSVLKHHRVGKDNQTEPLFLRAPKCAVHRERQVAGALECGFAVQAFDASERPFKVGVRDWLRRRGASSIRRSCWEERCGARSGGGRTGRIRVETRCNLLDLTRRGVNESLLREPHEGGELLERWRAWRIAARDNVQDCCPRDAELARKSGFGDVDAKERADPCANGFRLLLGERQEHGSDVTPARR